MSDTLKQFRVMLVETVRYCVDVLAEDEGEAQNIAEELWPQSPNPTDDFSGQGEGVESYRVLADPPNWTQSTIAAPPPADPVALLDALQDTVDELKACSAWEDALNGEDQMMLDAVNKAEALIALSKGEEFTPHKVGDEQ